VTGIQDLSCTSAAQDKSCTPLIFFTYFNGSDRNTRFILYERGTR
jgi:hypothetical protein